MKVSVITINYNGYKETVEFLDCVKRFLKQGNYSYEVIVVDNASTGDDADRLEREFPQVKVVRSEENLGFSGGNNLGVRYAEGEYYLFINNDVVFDSDFIEPLLTRFSKDERIGAISPSIYDYETKKLIFTGARPLGKFLIRINYTEQESDSGEIPFMIGTAVIVRKETYDKAGGWSNIYFLYEEELDWSFSIRRAGFSIWYEKNSCIYHKGSVTTGRNSPLQQYYLTRNRLLLYKRNLSGIYRAVAMGYFICIATPQMCLKKMLAGDAGFIKYSFVGIMDFLRGRFGCSSRNFSRQ